jgi:Zn-dependent protease with chaperone function
VFVMGFVFSVMGITDFVYSLEKKRAPWLGLFACLIATVVWFPFNFVWTSSATSDVFVGFGWLWFALGIIFLCFTLACTGLILRYSAKPEAKADLEIRERVD